jgi:hypothetical protein
MSENSKENIKPAVNKKDDPKDSKANEKDSKGNKKNEKKEEELVRTNFSTNLILIFNYTE